MLTDIEISNKCKKVKIKNLAKEYNIPSKLLTCYGDYIAKINYEKITGEEGKLILVTATNPTKFGEGKTTVSIGLADALNKLGEKTCLALREPSLGPVFGIKGGATGGGFSQVVPMEDINLHFTGDFHAITSANNLLASMIDNSIYFGNPLNINPNTVNFHRCLDLNDRALRNLNENIENKVQRPEKFNITAASEMMSILTLSQNIDDLKERIKNICIGFNFNKKPVYAKELHCEDAVAILLKDAIRPNIVQTLNKTLALVHLGPFANISHGCNSINATKTALKIGKYAVTEAGFGADLGAQKFLDLVCKTGGFKPSCVVLVTTIRSLKLNGGVDFNDVNKENTEAMKKGVKILLKHYNNLTKIYNANVVVTVNKFPMDTENEISILTKELAKQKISIVVSSPYNDGADGCLNLAKEVINQSKNNNIKYVYNDIDNIEIKIEKIAKNIYGANKINYSDNAKMKLEFIKNNKLDKLPVVIAKTQYSLSDDAKKIGVVGGFDFNITDFEINTGAGFIVAVAGKMLLMPGLGEKPNAINMKINKNKKIKGLF